MEFYLENKNISSATIKLFACPKCNFSANSFSIIGNSWGMNFLGIIGVFNSDKKELFITYLTKDEFQNYNNIDGLTICKRLSSLLNRNNLIFLKKESDENNKVQIKCLKCSTKLIEQSEQTLDKFIETSGTIYTIGSYPNG
jgi:hypothetical protein